MSEFNPEKVEVIETYSLKDEPYIHIKCEGTLLARVFPLAYNGYWGFTVLPEYLLSDQPFVGSVRSKEEAIEMARFSLGIEETLRVFEEADVLQTS